MKYNFKLPLDNPTRVTSPSLFIVALAILLPPLLIVTLIGSNGTSILPDILIIVKYKVCPVKIVQVLEVITREPYINLIASTSGNSLTVTVIEAFIPLAV